VHLIVQHAIDAVADADLLFVRLEVDVRCALLDRAQQDRVAQANDRRVFGELLEIDAVAFEVFLGELDLFLVEALHDLVVGDLGFLRVIALDGFRDGGFGRDDRLDVVAGREFDVVDGVQVRRIGHRHDERAAGPRHRDDLVALAHLLGDELQHLDVDLVLFQIDGLNLVLLAQEIGDLLVRDEAHLGERVAETRAVLALGFLGFSQLL
jgi:hypothetical protein